ncbi:TRAP transporter large permease [Motiliproteus coralliicola]|uniref:TRAP transporter large permease protein n=1 Tax=Motiliproteus coralliicola TaxID=2283196 RepID=A0A369WCG2_9GAMM|nr:TRAP transporter large permease [Motiliproteus coralliicola]RDE19021.1 TRAP transporter large permease [Motiliproteus coralliicola]
MTTLSITLFLIVTLLLVGMPVAYVFGVGAVSFVLLTGKSMSYLVPHAFWQLGSFALLSLPLFIIAGALMGASGISDRLVRFVNAFVGPIRGGLGSVTIVTCALFGAIAGSGASAIAAIGSIMIPKMVDQGYPRGYATALVGCSSVLALLIPPSVPMIIFALTSGVSVAAAFLSTILPGVTIALIYCLINYLFVRNRQGMRVEEKISLPERRRVIAGASKEASWALLMPVIMLGGIYGGIFTPTEAAAVALVYTLPVGFLIYKGLTFQSAATAIIKGAVSTGSIIAMIFFLFVMSRVMIMEQVPQQLSDFLIGLSDNPVVILLLINLILIGIGMLVDDVSGSILASIILMPVALDLGVHPIHFAAIVGTNLGLGNITPPCAPLLYMAGSVGKSAFHEYLKPTLRFILLGHLPVVLAVTFIPDLALLLPRLVMGIE